MNAMMGEHGAALDALLYLPVALVAAFAAAQVAADRGSTQARRLLRGLVRLPGQQQLALLLMVASATVHAALVPAHASEPVTAGLFAADAAALGVICLAGFLVPRWRAAASLLLLSNLGAYAAYLLAGWERADAVGIGTKIAEALALILILLPARRTAAIRLLEVSKP
ncbi:MAG: hypothetical protein J2P45_22345 [Candidatus Dormibacteraeota bacterium]|nr:hypothetical protein [Candidatus Dormibacteraeota bacterium]